MYRWAIAWRWLKRLPILWVSVVGVLLGVASILVVDSIFNGFLRELKRVYRGTASDLVVLTQVGSRRGPVEAAPVATLLAAIREVEGVAGAAPRLRRPCLLPKGMKLDEVVAIGSISRQSLLELVGIDADLEPAVSDLRRYLEQVPAERRVADVADPFDVAAFAGHPAAAGAIPILLGERCAAALKVGRGAVFPLLTLGDVDAETARETGLTTRHQSFVVTGTFTTDSFLEDLQRAYVPRDRLREFASSGAASTEIAVKADPGVDLGALRERIERRLAPLAWGDRHDRSFVLTWDDLERNVLLAVENQRGVLDLILFALVVVAGFNLLVSLHLLVTEKMHDVGTLAAMGGSAFGIASIFTTLGVLVTGLGAGLGLAGGFLLARNINAAHDALSRWLGRRLWEADVYHFDRIPIDFSPSVIGVAVGATFVVTLLFAFLASLRAARLDPVEALRRE